ncbi:MAG: cyclic di-GMP phosphodiesterase [Verrucomicrobiota bacterium]
MGRFSTLLLLGRAFSIIGLSNFLATQAAAQSHEPIANEQAAYEKRTRSRIAELAKMESAKRDRDLLALKGTEARRSLRASRAGLWTSLIATNWQVFQALRQQAAASPKSAIACTICDGGGSLDFCILCEHSGKCVSCQGSGKTSHGDDCPACRGSGKCYLCFGSGKMLCPFCDDGIISSHGPAPGEEMPLLVETPVRQIAQAQSYSSSAAQIPSAAVSTAAPEHEAAAPPPPDIASPGSSPTNFATAIALLLAGLFAFRKLAPRLGEILNARFNPWITSAAASAAADASANALSEDRQFAAFIAALKAGPGAPAPLADRGASKPDSKTFPIADGAKLSLDPLQQFFAAAPGQLVLVRKLFSEVSRSADEIARQKLLTNLSQQAGLLKGMAATPGLLPFWQLAFALEGLFSQLANKASNVTPSGLRTAVAAVDLLEALSVPGLKPDLLTNPPARLLAVDDDPIIRHAISFALKKSLHEPDIATDGKAALAMAEKQSYDVMFLDVEMPGINGFELCSKIHETVLNRTTPVVFVTNQSDFNARARSALTGAQDLIGKPFLTFEITLKALTLILRARLENKTPAAAVRTESPRSLTVSATRTPVIG